MGMMDFIKQAGKLKKAQKKINKKVIAGEADGARVEVTGGGDLKSFQISNELFESGKSSVENATAKAIEKALKKQKKVQTEMAKEALGGMSLPGM